MSNSDTIRKLLELLEQLKKENPELHDYELTAAVVGTEEAIRIARLQRDLERRRKALAVQKDVVRKLQDAQPDVAAQISKQIKKQTSEYKELVPKSQVEHFFSQIVRMSLKLPYKIRNYVLMWDNNGQTHLRRTDTRKADTIEIPEKQPEQESYVPIHKITRDMVIWAHGRLTFKNPDHAVMAQFKTTPSSARAIVERAKSYTSSKMVDYAVANIRDKKSTVEIVNSLMDLWGVNKEAADRAIQFARKKIAGK